MLQKTSRLWPSAGLAEALENLSSGPPSEGAPVPPKSPRIALNTLMLNLLNLCMSNPFLTFVVWERTSIRD